jgi:hypothetical protein
LRELRWRGVEFLASGREIIWSITLRRIAFAAAIALLAIFAAGPSGAKAQAISLVGTWRSCEPNKSCGIAFSFMPDGRVIKQYQLLGRTVTGYGRYRQKEGGLKIVWTRVSPQRICRRNADKNGRGHKQCMRPAEHNVDGPLAFDGFNALVWEVSGGPRLRLERRED